MDGISVDRIVGFEELGGKDEFPTLLLARRLIKSGCLRAMNKKEKGEIKIKRRGGRDDSDSGNDEYWLINKYLCKTSVSHQDSKANWTLITCINNTLRIVYF